MIINGKSKLAMAYKAWRSKKSITNFFRIVEDGTPAGGMSGGSGEPPSIFCLANTRHFTTSIGLRTTMIK